jgi:Fic family protein
MILLQKFEPQIALDDFHFKAFHRHEEIIKIYDFIDLPDHISEIEKQNSSILRNYYANALDHNLFDIKTVKYVLNGNIRAKGLNERAVEQYSKAEIWLRSVSHEPISVHMIYHLQKLLILDLYNNTTDVNLFSQHRTRSPEKLSLSSEQELENLFEFLNSDAEWHPVVQAWILHFKLLNMSLFSEGQTKIACLMLNFWLHKKGMDIFGLLSPEHELYINKNDYQEFFGEESNQDLQTQVDFGLRIYEAQLDRLKNLLRKYFRQQVEFDKHNPRLKNIMNYVFERGFRLKEIDDSILNKRQKLIMYIIQHKGFIATKELINEFNCNRKTIQRDFNALLDQNLVKTVGQGAGLKYAVNIEERKHDYLSAYQTDYLKEPTSLWG